MAKTASELVFSRCSSEGADIRGTAVGKEGKLLSKQNGYGTFSRGIAFVPFPTSGSHELVGSFIYIY